LSGGKLLFGGERGQERQGLLGSAARLCPIDGEHLPVGAGYLELVVMQFQFTDLRVPYAEVTRETLDGAVPRSDVV
jgi:hypothetical protein